MRTGGALTSSLVAEYAHRHRVKPGLTGWAQVNGSRGPLHTPEAARERIRYDVEYISRASLWFDFWIMLRTGPALLGDKINVR
jgi:lipopolysaccharide/colanic/teichoic acid biosynthesis glycosyltransferase